eukprot:CAMPEP_0206492252 /NCGR_PEP_ID=MMETSP0324_2-20121206/45886_1 /ASSEMBLY_ACC=CAM_ASM_000836 /TAXON_ID=2866 /ORGANISM="Crypthecodinium cohnii, Strain Seligo" /LENGTH=152 /DNA_ID=CAMNT_0053974409 /DNA_START=281 /DNA_END=735 /DNA_ORIENTATION=+
MPTGCLRLCAWLLLLPSTPAGLLLSTESGTRHLSPSQSAAEASGVINNSSMQPPTNDHAPPADDPAKWNTLALHLGSEGLQVQDVMAIKIGARAKVQVLDQEEAAVSCKGQVWSSDGHALLGCRWDMEPSCGIDYEGCGFWDGTCVWDAPSG